MPSFSVNDSPEFQVFFYAESDEHSGFRQIFDQFDRFSVDGKPAEHFGHLQYV